MTDIDSTSLPKFGSAPKSTRDDVREWVLDLVDVAGNRNAHELSAQVAEVFGLYWGPKAMYESFRVDSDAPTLSMAQPDEDVTLSVELPITFDEVEGMAAKFLEDYSPLRPIPDRVLAKRREDMGFETAQEGVALFSDLHYHSKIDPRVTAGMADYNIELARERLARWRDGILRFTQLSQLAMQVDTLNILALGDELEGHGAMFPTQALQMSESIFFQVMEFVEDMTSVLLDLLRRYEKIKIFKVHGNHGRAARTAKEAYGPDNWELMAWHLIAERVARHTGGEWEETETGIKCLRGGAIEFYISPAFIMFLEIAGWNVAMRHGHGIKGIQSTYTGALNNKFRLNAIVGEVINYYFKAHLHEAQSTESEIQGEVIQNGCFVGPSLLSVEMSNAAASRPSQDFMLFHPEHGKTHHYRIHLASAEETRGHEWIGRTEGANVPKFRV